MFCSNCGVEASGNFCSKCGASLRDRPGDVAAEAIDWTQEVKYDALIRVPEVRTMIARHAAMASKRMSSSDFLAVCDKIMPLGFPLEALGSILQPISARLGIKTGKEKTEVMAAPPGKVIVAALCSLARHGQLLRNVEQSDKGCLLEASIPSDMWSWEGTLFIGFRREEEGCRVEGATTIKGQLFDWGKSNRLLNELFADIKKTPA